MTLPKISVIMPVYNADKYLDEAINSILHQTFKDFELIILDDKSTDNSLEIINKYVKLDNRIVLISKEYNLGPAKLRNEGFEISKGKYIALMDADDISYSKRFEKQIDLLENNLDIGVCGTCFKIFGTSIESKDIIHFEFHDDIKFNFLFGCYIGNPTAMFRSSILGELRYLSNFEPMEDYELWSRLIFETKFYNIQEILLDYRWHNSNISHSNKENKAKIHEIIRKNQFKKLNIYINDTLDLENYYNSFEFAGGKSSEKTIQILNNGKNFRKKNLEYKIYNNTIIENKIYKASHLAIMQAKNYDISFLLNLLKHHFDLFRKLKLKYKLRIIKKSLFLVKTV